VAIRDNSALYLHGPVIGKRRDYDAPCVRAPNWQTPLKSAISSK